MPDATTRARILASARTIIGAEGVDALSMRRISADLGCSVGALYNHVSDKREILDALIAETHTTILACLAGARDVPDPRARLRRSIHDYVSLAAGLGDFYLAMMTSRSARVLNRTGVLHRGAAADRPAVAALRDEFAAAGDDESVAEARAQAVWSAVFGLAFRAVVEGIEATQRDRLADAVADLALGLLGGPVGSAR